MLTSNKLLNQTGLLLTHKAYTLVIPPEKYWGGSYGISSSMYSTSPTKKRCGDSPSHST